MTFNELLETVPPEVKAAIEEIEHKAGTTDADWEFVKAAGELLAAAKAASVVPVDVKSVYVNKASECVVAFIGDENKTVEFGGWLRDRIKERGEG